MTLIDQYKRAGRRTVNHGRPAAERRLRQARVVKFLNWCETRGVQTCGGIQQVHYASFVRYLHEEGLSERTIYRYRLALREFFRRWKIRVRVVTSPRIRRTRREEVADTLSRIPEISPALRSRIIEEFEKGNERQQR